MYTYEDRANTVAVHVWERWTNNGGNIDRDRWDETMKTVRDAVENTYTDDLDDGQWYDAAIARLEGQRP
jgi:hypothetical protein